MQELILAGALLAAVAAKTSRTDTAAEGKKPPAWYYFVKFFVKTSLAFRGNVT